MEAKRSGQGSMVFLGREGIGTMLGVLNNEHAFVEYDILNVAVPRDKTQLKEAAASVI